MATRERLGVWWMPSLPAQRVTGSLSRGDGVWELKTIGRLAARESGAGVLEGADDGGTDLDNHTRDRDDGLHLEAYSRQVRKNSSPRTAEIVAVNVSSGRR
jgi:hypothetical protein